VAHRNRKHGGSRFAKAVAAAPKPGTGTPARAGVPQLLEQAASALAALEGAGITVKLAHGAVITDAGYIFRIDGTWAARALTLTEFPAAPGDD
jgi:hypothetical protein